MIRAAGRVASVFGKAGRTNTAAGLALPEMFESVSLG
jgi:hypothetical protein